MKLGIVSDTHGHLELTRPAVRLLEQFNVEVVLHCGDIGTADIVRQFHAWPTHFVFGNCDFDHAELRQAIVAEGQTCHEEFGELQLAGARIGLLHSHDRKKFLSAIDSGDYDLVCYGHTHVAAIDRRDKTMLLNPGAVYRANPHSIAIVELAADKPITAEIVPL